jgi:hypothetical protein
MLVPDLPFLELADTAETTARGIYTVREAEERTHREIRELDRERWH